MCFESPFRRVCLLLVTASVISLFSGCSLPRNNENNARGAQAIEEKERNEKAARCKKEKQDMDLLLSKTKEFGRLPGKMQLVAQPYLKRKLFMIESRDKYFYAYDDPRSDCRLSADCNAGANCSPDKFSELRAHAVEEVKSVALISCRKVRQGDYQPASGSGSNEKIPGYDMVCDVTLVDRTIPAVIYKKTFKSELLMLEDSTRLALSGGKELVARIPYSEMDSFLLGLPQK